jgi:hypothetical protein
MKVVTARRITDKYNKNSLLSPMAARRMQRRLPNIEAPWRVYRSRAGNAESDCQWPECGALGRDMP